VFIMIPSLSSEISPPRRALLGRCRHGFCAAARACGVPMSSLRAHALGEINPTEPARLAYERAFGIPASSWPQIRRGRPAKRLAEALASVDVTPP
jgi:hypothetical protein